MVFQDDLLAELEELEQEELDKNLLDIQGTEDVPLPSVPSTSLPARPGIQHLYVFHGFNCVCSGVATSSPLMLSHGQTVILVTLTATKTTNFH